MASGLSHEINTPLSVALGSLELIDKIDPIINWNPTLGKVWGACPANSKCYSKVKFIYPRDYLQYDYSNVGPRAVDPPDFIKAKF